MSEDKTLCRLCGNMKSKTHRCRRLFRYTKRVRTYTKLREYFWQNPCMDCGESNPVKLQFDHRDPERKLFTIGSRLDKNWEALKSEIEKCDVVCANCHQARTAKDNDSLWYRLFPDLD